MVFNYKTLEVPQGMPARWHGPGNGCFRHAIGGMVPFTVAAGGLPALLLRNP